jgi:hypothetical protein
MVLLPALSVLVAILNEFYQVAFRKKIYATLEELQVDLEVWIDSYDHERTHQGNAAERRWRRSCSQGDC